MRSVFFTILLLSSVTANAALFSFSGNLENRDDVQLFNFTTDSFSNVTLQTFSYAEGGFDPALALYNNSGDLIALNDDAFDDGFLVPADPVSGFQYDSLLMANLDAGEYTVALMPFPIFPENTLADGFQVFDAQDLNGRSDFWALDIDGVSVATEASVVSAVPIPAAVWLFGTGLIGLFGMMKIKKTA